MKLKLSIKSVSRNYSNELDGTKGDCIESWIYGQFQDGTYIKIFDMTCILPEEWKNHEIEILIEAMITTEFETSFSLEGELIYNYKIPSKWIQIDPILKEIKYSGLKTSFGTFLLDPEDKNIILLKNSNSCVSKMTIIDNFCLLVV